MGPPDDPVHRQAITELNGEFFELFPRWVGARSGWGPPRWLWAPHRNEEWPQPIWYKHWISHIDERGRLVKPRPTEGWGDWDDAH
jgi:hypothetical protein